MKKIFILIILVFLFSACTAVESPSATPQNTQGTAEETQKFYCISSGGEIIETSNGKYGEGLIFPDDCSIYKFSGITYFYYYEDGIAPDPEEIQGIEFYKGFIVFYSEEYHDEYPYDVLADIEVPEKGWDKVYTNALNTEDNALLRKYPGIEIQDMYIFADWGISVYYKTDIGDFIYLFLGGQIQEQYIIPLEDLAPEMKLIDEWFDEMMEETGGVEDGARYAPRSEFLAQYVVPKIE